MSQTRSGTQQPAHFQPHIQGIRAIAVLLVVVYHFWPGRLSGGYIGVDIFFVISGFLITGQLARELTKTGRVKLGTFWAKRARRLLPASLLVLIVCSILTLVVLPLSGLGASLREILASTFYVENWALAANATNYLAASDETMVQHYWSLSLEEQFYVIWPLLLLGALWLGTKFLGERRWGALLIAAAVVTVVSLAVSVIYTNIDPAAAYFVTFTRMWEFGIGAMLALLPKLRPSGAIMSNLVGYVGLALVLGAGYFFDATTVFPGYMALIPVVGTAMLIASERSKHWWDIGSVLGGRPQRFLGDISYSLYLWHWPLIVIAPFVPGWGLGTINRIVLFVSCFVLAWLTKKFVEDPTRHWKFLLERRARATAVFSVALMAVSVLFAGVAWSVNQPKYDAAAAELEQIRADFPECFGALSAGGCENPELAGKVIPSPGFGNADTPGHKECFVQLNASDVVACEFGSKEADAPRVALIGDSHAYQYIEVMITLAEKNGWALTTYFKGACPWTTAAVGGPSLAFTNSCADYKANLEGVLADEEPYDAIFTAALAATPYPGSTPEQVADGFREAWQQAKGAPIVTIVDNPDFDDDPNKCLRLNDASECTEPRAKVLAEKDAIAMAGATDAVALLDLSDSYCDDEKCFSVVSGANVYRDQDHLTVTWTQSMAQLIEDAITKALSPR